jgi:hypothetical protein
MRTMCSNNLTIARRPGVPARPRPAAQARARRSRPQERQQNLPTADSRQSGPEFGPAPRSGASLRMEEAVAHDPETSVAFSQPATRNALAR